MGSIETNPGVLEVVHVEHQRDVELLFQSGSDAECIGVVTVDQGGRVVKQRSRDLALEGTDALVGPHRTAVGGLAQVVAHDTNPSVVFAHRMLHGTVKGVNGDFVTGFHHPFGVA